MTSEELKKLEALIEEGFSYVQNAADITYREKYEDAMRGSAYTALNEVVRSTRCMYLAVKLALDSLKQEHASRTLDQGILPRSETPPR